MPQKPDPGGPARGPEGIDCICPLRYMVFCQTKKFWPIMPANLSPEFLAARERYNSAKSIEEKISAVQEMLNVKLLIFMKVLPVLLCLEI